VDFLILQSKHLILLSGFSIFIERIFRFGRAEFYVYGANIPFLLSGFLNFSERIFSFLLSGFFISTEQIFHFYRADIPFLQI
jgi:hypothetical protein